MRWLDLLRGRTITAPATRSGDDAQPPAGTDGSLVLVRLDPGSFGIRDMSGRPLRWDDPQLDRLGAVIVDVRPDQGSRDVFAGRSAQPGTELEVVLHGSSLEVRDEHGRTLGTARPDRGTLRLLGSGHAYRALSLRHVRAPNGQRTQLHVLLVPTAIEVEITASPANT